MVEAKVITLVSFYVYRYLLCFTPTCWSKTTFFYSFPHVKRRRCQRQLWRLTMRDTMIVPLYHRTCRTSDKAKTLYKSLMRDRRWIRFDVLVLDTIDVYYFSLAWKCETSATVKICTCRERASRVISFYFKRFFPNRYEENNNDHVTSKTQRHVRP